MGRIRTVVVVALLMLASPLLLTAVGAQPLSEVAPGARVRIRAPGIVAGRYTGTVLSRTSDTIVVASSAAASVRVPVGSLTSVEVSRGRSRARGAGKGALWGGGIGIGLGVLAAAAGSAEDYGGESDAEVITGSILGGAIWGALIGAIVGSERWERYDLPARTSLRLPAAPGRIAVALAVAIGR